MTIQTPPSSSLFSLPPALSALPPQMHRNWGVQRGRGALGVYAPLPLPLMPGGFPLPPCVGLAPSHHSMQTGADQGTKGTPLPSWPLPQMTHTGQGV